MSPLTTNTGRNLATTDSPQGRKRAPLTQARAHATRERILSSALSAFAQIGYDAASLTSDILQPAEVSVGSFYHQFDSKRHVFVELVQGMIADNRQAAIARIADQPPADLDQAIRQLLTTMYDDVDAEPDAWRLQYRGDELNDAELRELVMTNVHAWNDFFAEQLARVTSSKGGDVVASTEITMALIHGLVRSYLASDDAGRAELRGKKFAFAVDYAVGGIRAVLKG